MKNEIEKLEEVFERLVELEKRNVRPTIEAFKEVVLDPLIKILFDMQEEIESLKINKEVSDLRAMNKKIPIYKTKLVCKNSFSDMQEAFNKLNELLEENPNEEYGIYCCANSNSYYIVSQKVSHYKEVEEFITLKNPELLNKDE